MAICRSHIFSQIVGSVAGITYFYNRYGSIVCRDRVVPVDPATVGQQTVRSLMSAAVAAWQALSQSDRDSWSDYASLTPWTNALGDDCRLTGFNMYIAVRLAVLRINPTANMSLLNRAHCTPGMFVQPEITFGICSGGTDGFKLQLKNIHPTNNMRCGVHISTPQNLSVNFWKGPYDYNSHRSTISTAPGGIATLTYNNLSKLKKYFLRIRAWDSTAKTRISTPVHVSRVTAPCI